MTAPGRRCMLGVAMSVLAVGCATAGRGSKDFQFVVAGIVRDSDGLPLEVVVVQLALERTAFHGTTSLREAQRITDSTGSFSFAFIVHRRSVPYGLICRKAGYADYSASGSAPPARQYQIALRTSTN